MLLATFCEGVPCIVCVCLNAYLSKLCNVYVRVCVCRVYGPCVPAVLVMQRFTHVADGVVHQHICSAVSTYS